MVLENVDGVAALHDDEVLQVLIHNAHDLDYTQFCSERVTFAEHGDPENRSRRIMVVFHSSVQLAKPWQFQMLDYSAVCAGTCKCYSALRKYMQVNGTLDTGGTKK